ncbi:DSBA oxidoreductase [Paucilactobacillus hokkaidonensis JCM 18461]|uniref:DSBA oxidoreductase n=2 Tax=Paucilactobacillus hokkaidonensis TaxID=1193095 RepID=A0A0A1GRV9_9LACO|nr:DHA2 family efflux MFS transporter permease subunit [Paucilactobacillus hokkaidonensis]KRO11406.1 EmrB QacA subfamily drug resistance transporter [Paucilactobacillus hokkaidonensis]BAP85042.1 DSBA oxidoreductase [Paucilactobacillus hokkaidonensis JCM 18461]
MDTSTNKQETAQAAVPVSHPLLAMSGILVGAFVGMLSETALNIALPSLMTQLHVGIGTIQWLVTGYLLVIGIVLPLSSLLARWFTTRQLIIFALIDFIVGATISALAPDFAVLLVGRMIQGIATGLLLPLMFTVATLIYPPYKLGTAMGMIGLVVMFAPAIGPTLAGIILGVLSWQWIFWAFVPFLLIALVISIKFLPNVVEITKPKVDILSIILSTLGFGGAVVAVSLASDNGWLSPVVLITLVAALLILFFYIRRQLHSQTPILNFHVFSLSHFSIGALLIVIDFGMIISSMYLLPMFWQKGLAVPVALTGIVMLPGGIVNALVSAIAGRFIDQLGPRKLLIPGFLISIIGILMLIFTSTNSPMWYVIMAHVIVMIGAPLGMAPAQTYGLNALDQSTTSDGSTIMNTFQQISGAVATAVATSLLGLGQHASTAATTSRTAFTNGVHTGLMFTLALAVIGFALSFTVKNDKHTA